MEGPSLLILKEELQVFLNQKVLKVSGNTKQPKEQLKGRVLSAIETWGKVLFLTFKSQKNAQPSIITKTHFLMFGSYRIDDPKENRSPRLELKFKSGTLYFYSCSFLLNADEYLNAVDRQVDLMSQDWDERHVLDLMQKKKNTHLCDLFLDQGIFAGSGNIVKNEVLFNIRRHPLTKLSRIAKKDWPKIVRAVHDYCWNFYEWKKKFELRRHWQVYRQQRCPLCDAKLVKENNGRFKRKSFFCVRHQPIVAENGRIKKLVIHTVLPMKNPNKKEKRLDH